jgi:ParB/RepB/Spo0J family partition protein
MTTPALTTELLGIPHAKLHPAPDNLRGSLTDVADLAQSIAEAGLLQPLRVTPHPEKAGQWMIIAGHRRHAAIGRLITEGHWRKTQPIACIHDGVALDDPSRIQAMLIENLQRVDLDPLEEAKGYQRLADEFGMSVRDIAVKVGRSKSVVSARTQLLKLPAAVQQRVSEGAVPLDLAAKLTRLPDKIAEKLVKEGGLSDWRVDDAIRSHERSEFTRKAKEAAKALGIATTNTYSWELQRQGFTPLHENVTVTDLSKVILTATPAEYLISFNAYDQKCTVWQASSVKYAPAGAEAKDLDPLELAKRHWEDEWQRRAAAHPELVKAWSEQRKRIRIELARAMDAKTVAANALLYIIDMRDDHTLAQDLGAPALDGDDDTAEDRFDQWLKEPANLTTLVAYSMLSDDWTSRPPIVTAARERVETELGPQPDHPRNVIGPFAPRSHVEAIEFYEAIGGHETDLTAIRAAAAQICDETAPRQAEAEAE